MKMVGVSGRALFATVILANLFWFATFYLTCSNFWLKIAISVLSLSLLALRIMPSGGFRFRIEARAVVLGIISAAILYFIFWAGQEISTALFPFGESQIKAIYARGLGTNMWMVFFLLLFITGPCEELFWRGFLQDRLMARFGELRGFFMATLAYIFVHIWSFNFMLIGAAAVAGSFWGIMYWRTHNLLSVIICHSLWSAFIFVIFPLIRFV